MSSSDFATVTALSETGPGTFEASVHPQWTIGGKPNGGYLLAMMGRAASAISPHQHVIAASAHYLHSPEPGTVRIVAEVLRAGRSASQLHARLLQDGRSCVDALFTVTNLDPDAKPYWDAGLPEASAAPMDGCVRLPGVSPAGVPVPIMDEVDLRIDPATLGFAAGKPTGRHRHRETGVTDAGGCRGEAAEVAQQYGAPVEHRALGQETDETQHAEQQHQSARQTEYRRPFGRIVHLGKQAAALTEHDQRQQQRDRQSATPQWQTRRQQSAHDGGTGQTADTEKPMETGHQGATVAPLHLDRVRVHRHIHRAQHRAEVQQRHRQRQHVRHDRQQRNRHAQQQPGHADHLAVAVAMGQQADQRHRQHRTATEGQQHQTKTRIVQPQPRLGVRHHRRPAGHADAGYQEDQAGGAGGRPELLAPR